MDLFDEQPAVRPSAIPASEASAVTRLLAAIGVPLGKNRIIDLARARGLRTAGGKMYDNDALSRELNEAISAKQITRSDEGHACAMPLARELLVDSALSGELTRLRPALFKALNVPERLHMWGYPRNEAHAVSVIRIALLTGMHGDALAPLLAFTDRYDPVRLFFNGLCVPFDARLMPCIEPALRDHLVAHALMIMLERPNPSAREMVDWAWQRAQDKGASHPLRYGVCEQRLWQGREKEALRFLQGDEMPPSFAIRAQAAAMRRAPSEARTLYARALDGLRGGTRKKVGLLPYSSAWLLAASCVMAGDPASLEEARRMARAEAKASGYDGHARWYRIEDVATERLGDREASSSRSIIFERVSGLPGLVHVETAAWLKRRTNAAGVAQVQRCAEEFTAAGYHWAARECEAAALVLAGKTPEGELAGTLAAAFASEQAWRRALAAISAMAEDKRADSGDTRLAWVISMKRDTVTGVTPMEQKRGPRGWGKGKRAAYTRFARPEMLSPQDARTVPSLERYGASYEVQVDRVLPALVGHPLVFFEDDLETPVELIAGEPEISVTRTRSGKGGEKGLMRVSLTPDIRALTAEPQFFGYEYASATRQRERTLLVKDTATRARVIRVTAAHRRVAELIGESLEVPEEGGAELSQAIESAAKFFHVHSDVASAVPETPADGSIRAELSPAGEGLRLRLAVQPFGDAGPRFVPGAGGARVIAELTGEKRAAVRELKQEQGDANEVVRRAPMLIDDNDDYEWMIDDPEQCLALVECLQGMTDKVRVEWPSGAKFKVTRAYGAADLMLKVSSGTDWFAAKGGITLDEGAVIDMTQLIAFARASGGRFVPLGEGGYLALTDDLRRRIDDLAGLGDVTGGALQVPALAAGALEEITAGCDWRADKFWQARMEQVREAQTLQAEPPSTFAGELRGYQADGFEWLARLAHWGAGACLADDMGLGKTVQALALLLRRAPDGAALVVAPTSVCAQWEQEARRFAPTLKLHLFREGEREKLVAEAHAFDVVVCTYTLMQQEAELFAGREWHTVILDEAQAIKNFATKRAQAVFSLKAGYRVATTGTPVENRLDELWTLFRFLNPGLLGSRERFNERYAAPIERMRDTRARARLKRLVRPFILRRTKSEVLTELPPRTEIVVEVEPSPKERVFYEALRRDALAAIDTQGQPLAQRRFQVLAQLMRLRRACCDPRLVAPDLTAPGSKLEAFAGIVEELVANKHKALVFSQFVDYLKLLRGELDRLDVAHQYLDGSTPAAERERAVAAFQKGEGDIFLISLRAGGFGLNLTAADYVIIADPWWNPAVEDQAASRAHRMGQERPVTVYRLVMKGSVEERIMAMHQDKRALAEGLFAGEEFGGAVSVDELVALMREEAGS